jgi:hypothetical protein
VSWPPGRTACRQVPLQASERIHKVISNCLGIYHPRNPYKAQRRHAVVANRRQLRSPTVATAVSTVPVVAHVSVLSSCKSPVNALYLMTSVLTSDCICPRSYTAGHGVSHATFLMFPLSFTEQKLVFSNDKVRMALGCVLNSFELNPPWCTPGDVNQGWASMGSVDAQINVLNSTYGKFGIT